MGIADLIQGQMQTAGQPREITQETTMDPGTDIGSDLSSIGMLIMTLLQMQQQQGQQDKMWEMIFGKGGQQPGTTLGAGAGGMPMPGTNQVAGMNPLTLFGSLVGR